ncbi:MAG: L-aspartate oxidase [Acidobacteriota bacterium]
MTGFSSKRPRSGLRRHAAEALVSEVRDADVLVIGTGVAGLSSALALAPRRVTVLTKSTLGGGGSSPWAQGGVAAALSSDDSPQLHAEDTLEAGAGLCDADAVALLTEQGPRRLRELIELGARFDRGELGELKLGREGAHSRRRILHAGGDATGREMVRALVEAVRSQPEIDIAESAEVTDLVRRNGEIVGAVARHTTPSGVGETWVYHRSPAVILATGGFGQLYSRTTNPIENTGDGLAMAARVGARLIDLEFVQFHPTALDVAADPSPLVTEALRGEGSWLVDERGHRFMPEVHDLAELAPRDVVARALWFQQAAGRSTFLDTRDAVGDAFPERFPTVWFHCRRYGIDPRRQPIPVTPAAHYTMAGIATDARGRTSLDGLWACGEVAASGVHGANRLASNSLLEALVYGHRVAADVANADLKEARAGEVVRETGVFGEDLRPWLRAMMWNHVGLMRDAESLETALSALEGASRSAADGIAAAGEAQNLWTVARLVSTAAYIREESRGSHHRRDFPATDIAWRRRVAWTYRPRSGDLPLRRSHDETLMREIA